MQMREAGTFPRICETTETIQKYAILVIFQLLAGIPVKFSRNTVRRDLKNFFSLQFIIINDDVDDLRDCHTGYSTSYLSNVWL